MPGPIDLDHWAVQLNQPVSLLDLLPDSSPHHPWSQSRILELIDQSLDGVLRFDEHVGQGRLQGQILDSLRSQFSLQLGARNTTDFLSIGFEECLKKPLPESIRHPLLEGVLLAVRKHSPPEVAQNDPGAFPEPEAHQRIERLEGIIKELMVIIHPGQTGSAEEITVKHLPPHRLDFIRFGEEAVAPHVKVKAVIVLCAGQTPNFVTLLKDERVEIELGQLIGRG